MTTEEIHQFDTPRQSELFNKITKELRCTVCQNQNLAESNANEALILRQKIQAMIIEGKPEKEIVHTIVTEQGDFVQYLPPFRADTLVLWLGPVIILSIAILFLCRLWGQIRR